MPITLLEYNKRLNGVIKDLESGAHGQVMVQVASDAIALIKQRVQERGLNPKGSPYPAYSKSYLEKKKKAGKYRGFVDFTLTGRTLGNVKSTGSLDVVSSKDELNSGIAVIKPTTQFEQDKLNWNTEKKGDILALSEQEKIRLTDLYEQGILDIWRKNKLL